MWKYDNLSPVQVDLLKRRIVDIQGDVSNDMAVYVREALTRLTADGSPEIEVRITSSGGNVSTGLDIYDLFRLYTGKKTGLVLGYARSMAAVILQGCEVRKCARHANVLIHHVSRSEISLDVLHDPDKLKETTQELEKSQQFLYAVLVARTKRSLEEIIEACKKSSDFTAEEALTFGLIDEIV